MAEADIPDDPLSDEERRLNKVNWRNVLSAILRRGLKDYFLPVHLDEAGRDSNRAHRESAESWVHSRGNVGITSFDGVCEALGLDPDRVRSRIESGDIKFDLHEEK